MIIYKATNKKTGKSYIGQTIRTFEVRKAEHLRSAANISRVQYPTPFHSAISEDGSGSFEWEILESCTSQSALNEREKFHIEALGTLVPSGYNQTTGGAMDESMSEDIRSRIAEGVRAAHQDPAYRTKVYPQLKGLIPPNKGVPMSEDQKIKCGAARKAAYEVPGYINPNVGQRRTDEQKARIKEGQQGKMAKGKEWHAAHDNQYTPEVRAKMREKKLGKKPSNTKKIVCIDTGQIFDGLTEASKSLNINRQSIYLNIKGKLKSAGGKHFKYGE